VNRRKTALLRGAALVAVVGSLASLAISAPDAPAQALTLLAEVKKNPAGARLASASVAKAEAALKRAGQMRASGDHAHGAMMEETALEWAQASQLLLKTAQAEQTLNQVQTLTTELETKVFRAQALVEQTVARRARAEEALRQLDAKSADPKSADPKQADPRPPEVKPAQPKPAETKGAKP
jgi:hypothetical protein